MNEQELIQKRKQEISRNIQIALFTIAHANDAESLIEEITKLRYAMDDELQKTEEINLLLKGVL